MTSPRLRKALEAFAHDAAQAAYTYNPVVLKELLAAYAAEPQERFEVGQGVRLRIPVNADSTGAVEGASDTAYPITFTDGSYALIRASDLELVIPDTPEPDAPEAEPHDWNAAVVGELREYAEPDAPPQASDEIGVGSRVRSVGPEPEDGTIVGPAWEVRFDGYGKSDCILASDLIDLTKLPPELPADHLDRVWIVGALIRHKESDAGLYLVVASDNVAYSPTSRSDIMKKNMHKTGWAFHPSSPVKEERND